MRYDADAAVSSGCNVMNAEKGIDRLLLELFGTKLVMIFANFYTLLKKREWNIFMQI